MKSIKSRYGIIREVKNVNKKDMIYRIQGPSEYCRGGTGMFDFEGGPFVIEGGDFYGMGIIKKVFHKYGKDRSKLPEGWCRVYVQLKGTNEPSNTVSL